MSHDDDGCPVGLDAVEQRRDLLAGRVIELAGRLVGEQQARAVGQRAGNRDALRLTAGQLGGPVVAAVREPDVVEKLRGALPPIRARHPGLGLRHLHVLGRGQHRRRKKRWKTNPMLRSRSALRSASGSVPHRPPVEQQRAARGRVHAPKDMQQRGLPAAGGTANRQVLAALDSQRHVGQRAHRSRGHRKGPRSDLAH